MGDLPHIIQDLWQDFLWDHNYILSTHMYIYIYIYIYILYQATLTSCETAKHVSVDCTITLLHFSVVEHSVKLVWVSFSNNAKSTTLVVVCALWPHIALRSLHVRKNYQAHTYNSGTNIVPPCQDYNPLAGFTMAGRGDNKKIVNYKSAREIIALT